MAFVRVGGVIMGEGGGSNEIFNPILTETLLADDSSNTGTLDFDGADYHDYKLLKVVVYDTVAQQDLIQLVVPSSFDTALQYFSSGVCFGRYKSSYFAYYKTDLSGNWIKGYSDRIYVKKVYGLEGQNCDITTTNIYIGSSNTPIDQTISYADKLSNFNMLVAMCNDSTSDCEPCAYALSGCGSIKDYLPNLANGWNSGVEATVSDYEISSYYWFSVDGVTLTAKQDSIQFSETLICDNTELSTSAITFTDDYDNYDFVLFEVYNVSSTTTSYILTLPEQINHIISISTYVNFNEWTNNQYGCYSVSNDHLTWSVYARRNLLIKTVKGINCTNRTVNKTIIYERANRSTGAVTVEPVEDVADYDYLFFSSSSGSNDETQPCFPPVCVEKTFFDITPEYRGAFFKYNTGGYAMYDLVRLGHHSIVTCTNNTYNNYYLMGAYGIKFT